MNKRTQYTAEYKAGVVLRVLREEETVAEIAATEGLNPVMISRWKAEFLERASMVFDRKPTEAEKEEHLTFIVGYGFRSNDMKNTLDSVPGGTSWHNYGLAVDCKGTSVLKDNDKYPRGNLKADGIFEKYGLCREAKDTNTGEWEWWHITPIDCYPPNAAGKRVRVSADNMYDWANNNATYPGQPW